MRTRLRYLSISLLLLAAQAAPLLAHTDDPQLPRDPWPGWTWEPATVLLLGVTAWLYGYGLHRLWKSAESGRGIRKWQALCFGAGWVALVIALLSPIDSMGGVLFSAHMVQHELLMLVAAPLLVLGHPLLPFLWALPILWRRRLGHIAAAKPVRRCWRVLTRPMTSWIIHAAAVWIWHVPLLFQATLENNAIHVIQHASFLGSALLFAWSLLHGTDREMGYGAAVLYVFLTALHTSILGALLTFAVHPWYPAYQNLTYAWGLTPIEDQQLGGLIMWIPGGVVYLAAGLALIAAWMQDTRITAPAASIAFDEHLHNQ
jgi:putative membrane protein